MQLLKQKRLLRTGWRAFAVVFIVSSMIVAGNWLWSNYDRLLFVPVTQVKVYGPLQYTESQAVQNVVDTHIEGGLLALSLSRLQQDLLALPWLNTVEVRRVWPDTIILEVAEHQPAFYWNQHYLLSNHATLIPKPKGFHEKLPRLQGPSGQHLRLQEYYFIFHKALGKAPYTIDSLIMHARGSWNVTLVSQEKNPRMVHLALGREKIFERFDQFLRIDGKIFDMLREGVVVSVDMRYRNGFAIASATQ